MNAGARLLIGASLALAAPPGAQSLPAGDYAVERPGQIERLAEPHSSSPFGIVTLSVGTAVTRGDDLDVTAWLKAADAALYRSKELGRNRISLRSAA
jgi:diguanylate cyclase (GGDEF)-like protein